ncbi:MAG TPA: hypothetical protein DDW94_09635 [Deltaproteobacteria bacterium]|nr:MAG: hypothetical protein A2Z79_12235 [Deltaproteobacteria bacterium GWA2_55_82]OGQ63942.1 MAG: hypothetical protein A3I81_07765 [Deltaproteobacteria bacterium RIFCSPLOWO2_02_FULL_55_12]OIJ73374.1 MAG: hypothetical protein A2V21_303305 [Deltaproteobacteria bacterium GWC2_55_46]HBG47233.1 hypothetical protein [Deltaproteobacteria bacterium]HCY09999.1 hypothetical protein [Deltaproteobacteria bacterium]
MENWLKKLIEGYQAGKLAQTPKGGIGHILIKHDHDCPRLKGKGPCTCKPDVSVMDKKEFN